MIQWLVQSMADLGEGTDPHSWLNAEEAATFAKLNTPKRREDWLLGRWTAKQLVRSTLQAQRGEAWSLERIGIGVEASGALSDQPGYRLGADIEQIESRETAFVADFFTAAEIQSVEQAPEALRASLVTAIWSGKEAVLKAIREGLRSDTRAVECIIEPLPLPVEPWQPFTIRTDPVREPIFATLKPWQGWWRSYQGYILTMVVGGRE